MTVSDTQHLCPHAEINGGHTYLCRRLRDHAGEHDMKLAQPGETRWMDLVTTVRRRHVVIFPATEFSLPKPSKPAR